MLTRAKSYIARTPSLKKRMFGSVPPSTSLPIPTEITVLNFTILNNYDTLIVKPFTLPQLTYHIWQISTSSDKNIIQSYNFLFTGTKSR